MEGLSTRRKASDISNEEFLSITREKYYRAIDAARPLFAWFSLTGECNLHCRYCFTDARICVKRPGGVKGELSTKQVFSILDNVGKAGTVAIQFAGGEPLLRDDLVEIISYLILAI